MGRGNDAMDDPKNIRGMGSLLNMELISDDTDPTLVEQSIINGLDDLETVEEIDPIALYEKDCAKIIDDESGEESESESEPEEQTEEKSDFQKITEEQTEQNYINNFMEKRWGDVEPVKNDMPMRLNEHKLGMLEEIDDLKEDLKSEVNLDTLPNVNYNSSLEDIERVHIILRKKHERIRYSNTATDWVMLFSGMAEAFFDGEREVLGMRPNMKGISKKLKVKLRRIRYDTSVVVGQILNDNNIGPIMRIGIELIPTILIHSQVASSESKSLNERLSSAQDELRQFDVNRDKDDLFN